MIGIREPPYRWYADAGGLDSGYQCARIRALLGKVQKSW